MAKKNASKDSSFEIPQMEKNIHINRKHKLTAKQTKILKAILSSEGGVIIIDGPAGTSKTYLALYSALQDMLNTGRPIMYLRSVVESSTRRIGHLPGNLDEKFFPFTGPLDDKLEEFLEPMDIKYLKENLLIEARPINYIRGRDWKSKIVIIDEAQNLTREELLTAMTRASIDTKIIMCGDLMQSDIKDGGFEEICEKFADKESKNMGIHQFTFTKNDILRSPLVKFIVSKFQQK